MLTLTSFSNNQFYELLQECNAFPEVQIEFNALFMYLMKMRTGRTFKDIGHFFRVSDRNVSAKVANIRQILFKTIVPKYLTLKRTRENLVSHKTITSSVLFDTDSSQAHLIMDGTYIYIEKSQDHQFQKATYNAHKKRNYIKMMMGTSPDGEIIFADGPYMAVENDATITKKMLEKEVMTMCGFQTGDVVIVDRGFRDCGPDLMNHGFVVQYPKCSDQPQLTTKDANLSRLVTKIRYDIERINGVMKNVWKIFNTVAETYWVPHIATDFQICAALVNRKQKSKPSNSLEQDEIERSIAERMIGRLEVPNTLAQTVRKISFAALIRQKNYLPFDNDNCVFPELTMTDLTDLTFGPYQIQQAQLYLRSHLDRNNENLSIFTFTEEVMKSHFSQVLQIHPDATLIMSEIASRFVSSKSHRAYVPFTSQEMGSKNILGYCCVCKSGLRTVGMCSHVTAILFYLGYAHYNGGVKHVCLHLKNMFDIQRDYEENVESD